MNKKPDYLHFDTDSWKLKFVKKYWGWHGQKWVGYSGLRTLKLALSQKGLIDYTDIWCVEKNSEKPKVTLIIFGWHGCFGLRLIFCILIHLIVTLIIFGWA